MNTQKVIAIIFSVLMIAIGFYTTIENIQLVFAHGGSFPRMIEGDIRENHLPIEATPIPFDIYAPITPTFEQYTELPIRVTVYWPFSCINADGSITVNINCNSDPWHIATGLTLDEDMFYTVAACPKEFVGSGKDKTTVFIIEYGSETFEFWCADRGGAVTIKYWNVWDTTQQVYDDMWIISVDVMVPTGESPLWQGIWHEWRMEERYWNHLRDKLYTE